MTRTSDTPFDSNSNSNSNLNPHCPAETVRVHSRARPRFELP